MIAGLSTFVALAESRIWCSTAAVAENDGLRIGLLLPPEESESRSVREGALLAQEQMSKTTQSKMEVIIRGRVGQWGADAVEAARMVTDDGVEGLITPPDGAASHLTLQVSGRTAVPVVTLCGDSSVGLTGVPWLLRVVPRTADEAKALFLGLPNGVSGRTNWLAVVPDGRAGREISRDLGQAARRSRVRLEKIFELNPALTNADAIRSQVLSNGADLVLLWLDPVPAGIMATNLRTAGYQGALAGPGRLQSPLFLTAAGTASVGFFIPTVARNEQSSNLWRSFQASYQERWGHQPTIMAGMSYDAAMLLLHLLSKTEFRTPPHRVASGFSCPGVTGELAFDDEGNRKLRLELLQVRDGRFVPMFQRN